MNTAYAQTSAVKEVTTGTTTELIKLLELIITRIPLWFAAIILMIFTALFAKIVRRIVENKLAESGIEEEHKELQILGGRIAYSGILVLGITVSLKVAGIDLTTILAAVAFGIGFALKDLIMNFLAGIMILISRHFVIGDFIKVGDTTGRVIEIQSRVTVLKAINGTKVIVPNAQLFTKQVISLTGNPFRRIEISVGVDPRNNLENAIKVAMNVVKGTHGVLAEPQPAVLVNGFKRNGTELKVLAWVESKGGFLKIKSNLTGRIKEEFDKHGIKMPWPTQAVMADYDPTGSEKIMEEPVVEKIPEAPPAPAVPLQTATVPVAVETPIAPAAPADAPLKPLGDI